MRGRLFMCGKVKCLGAARSFFVLAANSFPVKSCKRTLKKIVEKQKRGQDKYTSCPEIPRTTRFLEKTCKQEFRQNQTGATTVA